MLDCSHPHANKPVFDADVTMVVCIALTIAYLVPVAYLIKNRQVPEIKIRSPKLAVCAIVFLYGDSLLNTFIYCWTDIRITCSLSLIATTFCFQGAIVCYLLRIARVYRFY